MSTSDYPRGGGLGWVIGGIWSVGSSRDSASAPDAGAGAVPAPGGHRRGIGRRLRLMAIWVVSLLVVAISLTFRRRILTDDPRPSLRDAGESFLLAIIHAHQLAAVFCNDEPHMRAMVSRSTDGDLLAPLLHLRRVTPVRGSTQRRGVDKGGRTALDGLAEGVLQGIPAVIAVDGPRGPRNTIHRGIALLAIETGAPIACAAVVPTRRWFFSRAWDRFQIPKPFCRLDISFAPLIHPGEDDVETLRGRVAAAINELENRADPLEARFCREHPELRRRGGDPSDPAPQSLAG